MAFDQATRNRLARFVGEARALLTVEFTRQLQLEYGLDPSTGEVTALDQLAHLDDARRETARVLHGTLQHYLGGASNAGARQRQEALERIVREQAFTVLNRLCALRMAEARGLLIESVAQGYRSPGFQLYAQLAGAALGETGDSYRAYLHSLWDEFALDLPVLFDRYSPQGRLFPREAALLRLLDLINDPEIDPLWAEDETIGWIYQYFNSKEERQAMRKASAAPRNSRELAVRNQFFTPRYVVEFLTDNTLGRIWYEMTQGETALKDTCRYLVRRPAEVFLWDPEYAMPPEGVPDGLLKARQGEFSALPEELDWNRLQYLALSFDGYEVAKQLGIGGARPGDDNMQAIGDFANERLAEYRRTRCWRGSAIELWVCLFFEQRRWRWYEAVPRGRELAEIQALYAALREALQHPPEDLSQEELLRQPVFIPYRAPKDPRDIKMLDPACGSMHFGLYAFDLYERIYDEAWEKGFVHTEDFGDWRGAFHDPDEVRLRPGIDPISNYSHEPVPLADAYVVVTHEGDFGDGVDADTPYIVPSTTRFRVPFDYRVKLTEFDYAAALRAKHFDADAGAAMAREAGCFVYKGLPPASREEAYASFRRQIPRLIIEHNLHGIDIDPRAVQIAGLSLWLRAQKSWHEQGVSAAERPRIQRSHIVCAEPMPGDKQMLEEYLQEIDPRLRPLVRTIWEKMQLADELGSLLRIEKEIAEALKQARTRALVDLPPVQMAFCEKDQRPRQLILDLKASVEEREFWGEAEGQLLGALRELAARAGNGQSMQRRLFTEDAEQGFAFIDLCRDHYDVVVMNPPFGQSSASSDRYLRGAYPENWKDLYACFMERSWEMVYGTGRIGAITSSLFLYSKQLRQLRSNLISTSLLGVLVELGSGVLDTATVDTALSVQFRGGNWTSLFLDLTGTRHKSEKLLLSVRNKSFQCLHLSVFQHLQNWPLCYHLNPRSLSLWQRKRTMEPDLATVVAGNHTFDDERFLRLRYEVPMTMLDQQWWPYVKGGVFQLFLSPTDLVVNWLNNGREMRENQIQRYGTDAQVMQSAIWWLKSGITYPRISSIGFGPHVLASGQMFSEKGMCVFPNREEDALSLLSLLSSTWTQDLVDAFGRHRAYENTAVANLPFGIEELSAMAEELRGTALQAIEVMHKCESGIETSPYFLSPLGLRKLSAESVLDSRCFRDTWHRQLRKALRGICDEIDVIVRKALFPQDEAPAPASERRSALVDRIEALRDLDPPAAVAEVIQYLVGCLFARWDIRRVVSGNDPDQLDPFAALPLSPPGMLWGHGALATMEVPGDYPLSVSVSGVMAGDEGHGEDIVARVREALQVIWRERAEAIEQEACDILGVRSLREYFGRPAGFFADHLKRYSKSRRVAPIYWPLSTASGSYTLWLYYHRLTDQTLYTCVNDYVEPKLKQVSEEAGRLRRKPARSAAEERELTRLSDLEGELRDFRAELLRIAAFWKPNLNDGVQITAAPLWRLFQHRPWQKRLKETWEKLEAGEYDWAHLAYSIWPERVRGKCRHDKSLAIAHGLEDLYVGPPPGARKRGRRAAVQAEDEDGSDEDQ